jgi:hypothetical protein
MNATSTIHLQRVAEFALAIQTNIKPQTNLTSNLQAK